MALIGSINAPNDFGFKNRIINGAMVIDQRNAGASVTPASFSYTLDRWGAVQTTASKFSVQQNAASVTPPSGFTNYLGVTSLSAYSVGAGDTFNIYQSVEGFNCADFAWGTASAQSVTLSFWVRSSLTGTFGGAIKDGSSSKAYPFTYTISTANTWEYETITIVGPTSGQFSYTSTTNGIGLQVMFGLGSGATYSGTAGAWATFNAYTATGAVSVVGTNGATFYITGVQLEKGTVATTFEYRPFGTELILAQRYFETTYPIGTAVGTASATATAPVAFSMGDSSAVTQQLIWMYKVKKGSAPNVVVYNPSTGASGSAFYSASSLSVSFSAQASRVDQATFGSGTAGMAINNTFSYYLTASSEL